jgi:hypothetical protein
VGVLVVYLQNNFREFLVEKVIFRGENKGAVVADRRQMTGEVLRGKDMEQLREYLEASVLLESFSLPNKSHINPVVFVIVP